MTEPCIAVSRDLTPVRCEPVGGSRRAVRRAQCPSWLPAPALPGSWPDPAAPTDEPIRSYVELFESTMRARLGDAWYQADWPEEACVAEAVFLERLSALQDRLDASRGLGPATAAVALLTWSA